MSGHPTFEELRPAVRGPLYAEPYRGCSCRGYADCHSVNARTVTRALLYSDISTVPKLFRIGRPLRTTIIHGSEVCTPVFGVAAAIWEVSVTLEAWWVAFVTS